MLSLLSKKYNSNNMDLYCDEGLPVFRNSGQQAENIKKLFKKFSKIKADK